LLDLNHRPLDYERNKDGNTTTYKGRMAP